MSKVESLILPRLDKARRTGAGKWLACCPAHDDKSPSLSIKETDDGTILVHCFANCEAHEVVSAMGLELSDLYPERSRSDYKPRPPIAQPFDPWDVLRAIAFESAVVLSACGAMLSGEPINPADRERLSLAHSRIQAALNMGRIA